MDLPSSGLKGLTSTIPVLFLQEEKDKDDVLGKALDYRCLSAHVRFHTFSLQAQHWLAQGESRQADGHGNSAAMDGGTQSSLWFSLGSFGPRSLAAFGTGCCASARAGCHICLSLCPTRPCPRGGWERWPRLAAAGAPGCASHGEG